MDKRSSWLLAVGGRYWGAEHSQIASLPMPRVGYDLGAGDWVSVPLPEWAAEIGVGPDRVLMVDASAIVTGDGPAWERCDWLSAAWQHLTGAAERDHERRHGPILSYAFRLKRSQPELFDRAWVNRIFLFLRRWAARRMGRSETSVFGALPTPEIILTHDVDAVKKTPEIRLKQSTFHLWNAVRALLARDPSRAVSMARNSARFALRSDTFWTFSKIRSMEDMAGLRSILHFYGGPAGLKRGRPERLLLDPAYDILHPDLRDELHAFQDGGWTIGLHQSTAAWKAPDKMAEERDRVEKAAGNAVTRCRQHWLFFSWAETWRAQERAGLLLDSTLGFNDRPGFRNGAALRFPPWDFAEERPLGIEVVPMVFMDSQFYDYDPMSPDARTAAMAHWINEIRAVHGEATVNWHTHTIGESYGWEDGYRSLLDLLS